MGQSDPELLLSSGVAIEVTQLKGCGEVDLWAPKPMDTQAPLTTLLGSLASGHWGFLLSVPNLYFQLYLCPQDMDRVEYCSRAWKTKAPGPAFHPHTPQGTLGL